VTVTKHLHQLGWAAASVNTALYKITSLMYTAVRGNLTCLSVLSNGLHSGVARFCCDEGQS